MKEPIYKAKAVKDEKLIEGNYFELHDDYSLNDNVFHCISPNPMWNNTDGGISEIDDYYVINPNTLCEYTGRKDSNGNKIYTNDVLTIELEYDSPTREYPPDYEYIQGIVKFDADNLQYIIHFAPEVGNDSEEINPLNEYQECKCWVKGNIFDLQEVEQ